LIGDCCKDRVSGQQSFDEISFGSLVLFIFTKLTTQSLCSVRIVKRGHLLLPIFRSPYKKEKNKKKSQKKFGKKKIKKYVVVRKDVGALKKRPKIG